MKKILFIILIFSVSIQLNAKSNWNLFSGNTTQGIHQISAAVRAGVTSFIGTSEDYKSTIGFQTMLDLQYAYYFKRDNAKQPYFGFLTGISAGYVSSGYTGSVFDSYSTTDSEGDRIDYTITANEVKTQVSQVQLQVPIMFSMMYNGLYVNVGPRFTIPVYSPYTQKIDNVDIQAYYEPYGVTLSNKVITGKVFDDQLSSSGTWQGPTFMLDISAEIGYAFSVADGHMLSVGAYFDYNVYNNYKPTPSANQSMINISQVGADELCPPPTVEVLPLVSTYIDKLSCFNAGLKLVYHLNFK